MTNSSKLYYSLLMIVGVLLASLTGTPARAEAVTETFRGLKLNAELKLAPGKSLSDGVILMIPSPLGHHRMEVIVSVQDVLAENGINSFAPSLSLSHDNRRWYIDCNKQIRHTAEDIFDEIDYWVAWLRQKGAGHITLLGHSLSANYVTVYTTRRAPAAVKGLILLAPATLAYGQQGVQRYEKRFKVPLRDVLARADRYIADGKGAEPMAEKTDYYFCPAASVTPNAFLSLYREMMSQDFPTLWGTLPRPSLLIAGTGDKRSPQIIDEAKRAGESGNIQVVVIENGGHFFRGLYTDDAVESMVKFISGI
ncbi:MAG: alpha/beta hydrolase, partial [Rhodospirillales bacterium]|nr:alpha/beta hydrolase [Rhodospirillales bacterium]